MSATLRAQLAKAGRAPLTRAPQGRALLTSAQGSRPSFLVPGVEELPERIPWGKLVADGVTPQPGIVLGVKDYGALIALSQTQKGLVPSAELPPEPLELGQPVTAYIKFKTFEAQRLNLRLAEASGAQKRLTSLCCDGRSPYQGTVTSLAPFGVFINLGFERTGFLPQRSCDQDLQQGDTVTVYAIMKHWRTGRFELSLTPLPTARRPHKLLAVDGITPYQGVVGAVVGSAAVVDIGFDVQGTLLMEDNELQPGDELTVYAVRHWGRKRRLFFARTPRLKPLLSVAEVVADGQTPYWATVVSGPTFDFFELDIGCADLAKLPLSDPAAKPAGRELLAGDKLQVFVQMKQEFNGVMVVSSERRKTPRTKASALLTDGTPYPGIVTRQSSWGTHVDFGCEAPGLLLAGREAALTADTDKGKAAALLRAVPELAELPVGAAVTTYVWTKCDKGKVCLGLEPRPQPAIPLAQLPVDGVTPLTGMVTTVSSSGIFLDVGSDAIGRLNPEQLSESERREAQALRSGEVAQVFARRRSLGKGIMALGLRPDAVPRLGVQEVERGGRVHEGRVVSVSHNAAFVDLGCVVSGLLPELVAPELPAKSAPLRLAEGDKVLVRVERLDDDEKFQLSLLQMIGGEVSVENSKHSLQQLIQQRLGRPIRKGDMSYQVGQVEGAWEAILAFPWEGAQMKFTGKGAKKKEAEQQAATRAVQYLFENK
ncbi:unnamed protein product [Effrenium voratum]|uniref:Uncharacterized protein n=1 Tax=Effrenium voratum TaxID=2562239 RepID=A0AA36J3J0_9DINO|nr:unnamed protein product [Effrenium voratum]